jgi:hypothetical protein
VTDPPRHPEPGDDSGMRYDREPGGGLPRWLRLAAIIVAVLALLVVVMLLIGGGHGPRRHSLSGDVRGPVPPASAAAVHAPPQGTDGADRPHREA